MKRSYIAVENEVFSHIETDRDLIHTLAFVNDVLKAWKNPDDLDYRVEECESQSYHLDGKVHVIRMQEYEQSIAAELFSHEIRSKNSLNELGDMYKRLKKFNVPLIVFHNILRKMLWISSGKKKVFRVV